MEKFIKGSQGTNLREFPNVLRTHTADMFAPKVMEERNEE